MVQHGTGTLRLVDEPAIRSAGLSSGADESPSLGLGLGLVVAANVWWGLSPIFWKQLTSVAAFEAVAHRVVWTTLLLAAVHTARGRWRSFFAIARVPRNLLIAAVTAVMLFANWAIFIWAVGEDRVIESALGYFLLPLVSVVFGRLFFHERLRPVQWFCVGLAGLGVLWLAIDVGTMPWVALTLAISFGIYGALRKSAAFEALDGLSLEVMFLVLPLAGYLIARQANGSSSMSFGDERVVVLLLLTSVVTAVPLVAFASGVRLVPLSIVGLVQYVNPSLQFLVGVLLYNEAFRGGQVVGYAVIWVGLVIFAAESMIVSRRSSSRY